MIAPAKLSISIANPPTAIQKRAAQPLLEPMWGLDALLSRLPLVFPVDEKLPPSPKTHYRSDYRYLGPGALVDETLRATLSDFEIALCLIDFSPLERVLARFFVASHKGQMPFDPVSMFLCICLRREQNLSWRGLAKRLAGAHGGGWRTLFGFAEGQTPSASGLRHFFNMVGAEVFDDLCPRFIDLLRQQGLCPEHSTYPGDPQNQGVTVTQDGQLHLARSRPSCQLATNSCYRSIAVSEPSPSASDPAAEGDGTAEPGHVSADLSAPACRSLRPCRAREKGLLGCACDSPACQEHCERASRLDPDARFIHYEGHNDKHGHNRTDAKPTKEVKTKGIDIFGYRSIADRVIDDRFSVAWTIRSSLYPANTDERTIFVLELAKLLKRYPSLKIGEWLDDSGVGYEECLNAIWNLGALRMIDIRAHETDKDPEARLRRGYNEYGYPLCPHGYGLHSNGYDEARRRRKYVCRQRCAKEPLRQGEAICAVQGCPFLDSQSLGFTVNVGRTLPDGSVRLARDIPYGTDEWDERYGRRNISESRNGQMEGMGLKRMRSYGTERDTKEVQVGDFIINLRTLGRLVREATKPIAR